ncbi:hypothetical protein [Rickettsiales endosymbiont of Peranema trichophorum]|uniref:hypothetical protein n=1 Tax=Rickettsiales endosymbiont of Peranema trichophorum TaxID=2486577 RepID=UPI0013EE6293|nr:hypothetical protein [Rickettsiales endosymbiont of Peranema trichophorum]
MGDCTAKDLREASKEELIETGKRLKAIEIARKLLLRREPIDRVSEITGLTRQEVQSL